MQYRLRYLQDGQNRQHTVSVEAESPSEAMLKFQLTHDDTSAGLRHIVTSVSPEESWALM